jgi:2-dehydro-3-deoxyphosphogalactonate aldolase
VNTATLDELLARAAPPLIAILRGVRPEEVVDIGLALVDAGLAIIEVPLNSPEPLLSVQRLSAAVPSEVLVGVGTVLSASAVDEAAAAGARLIVAPNTDTTVIGRSLQLGLDVVPGMMTASEAFAACAAGARHLKLFPASSVGTSHLKALFDVLPRDCRVWATGGTHAGNLAEWLRAGATGIGVGGALYRPGASALEVGKRAAELVATWRGVKA